MGISRGQLVDGALVLAQLMAPSVEVAQRFGPLVDAVEGDAHAKVKAVIAALHDGLQNDNWPPA